MPAGSHHIGFTSVPPGMNWALLGLPAEVALIFAPAPTNAASVPVRR